ncbi:MAG: tetratricopeptide repeat protein [Planctomycetota bacterium]|jgi:tetratricopeptide (TPR) repeat protein
MKTPAFKKLIALSAIIVFLISFVLIIAYRNNSRALHKDIFLISDPDTKAIIKQRPKLLTQSILKKVSFEQKYSPITIDYPFNKSVFPPEIVAPTFLWHDPQQASDLWLIDIVFQDNPHHIYILTTGKQTEPQIDPETVSPTNAHYKPSDYDAAAKAWSPHKRTWDIIKKNSVEKYASLTVIGFNRDETSRVLSRGSIQLMTSKDPVGAPIFYRDVPLMPSETEDGTIKPLVPAALPLISWRLRDISKPAAPVVLKNMPTCANCHSFSSDGKTLGMDMDGPTGDKGAYGLTTVKKNIVITNDDIISWNSFKYKPKEHKTIGFFSQVSPDGQYVVSTLNESTFVTNYPDFKFLQAFYPTKGILAIYSKAAGTMEPLPGADDPNYVHSNGCWSPDGKYILFSRAKAMDNYLSDERPTYSGDPRETPIQYDLYKIPFNGGKGGTPEPIEGASNNGMSNSFPRFSPDRKWIIFVQAEKGQLMRPDSRLYIIPAQGGRAREMNCNLSCMNSWHSWSPNSKWLVFSSKGFTPFTQMFLTHIDENGIDSPPILIPNSTAANRAINIPEFLNNSSDAIASISAPTQESYRHFSKGQVLMYSGKYSEALAEFEKSLQHNPYYGKTYGNIASIMVALDRNEAAFTNYYKALELEPENAKVHCNLATLLVHQGKRDEAIEHFKKALQIRPDLVNAHDGLSGLLIRQGKVDECIKHLDEVLRLEPDSAIAAKAHHRRGLIFVWEGNLDEAIKHYTEALTIKPDFANVHSDLGYVLVMKGNFDNAAEHYSEALRLNPDRVEFMNSLAWILATHKDSKFYNPQKAVRLAERACKLTRYEAPGLLDTLAAAYAAVGRFSQAIQTAERALQVAQLSKQRELTEGIQKHLRLYKAGLPCTESSLKLSPE